MKKHEKIIKQFGVTIKAVDSERNSLRAVFSTQDTDRHGDIVMQNGWDLENFKRNPVILNGHNYGDSTEVIGRAENFGVVGNQLEGDIVFAVKENPKAEVIFNLYAGGFLHAFSVGFIPLEFENDDPWSGKILRSELLEVSAVSVPANAMALAKSKGLNVAALEPVAKAEGDEETVTNFPEEGDNEEVSLSNSNFGVFDFTFAKDIRDNCPMIWAEAGNARANEVFELWDRYESASDRSQSVLEWVKEREAWAARNFDNRELASVVAQVKWGVIGTLGETEMKRIISEERARIEGKSVDVPKEKDIAGERIEAIEKAGAVLSKRSRTHVVAARDALQTLLDHADKVDAEESKDEEKAVTPPVAKKLSGREAAARHISSVIGKQQRSKHAPSASKPIDKRVLNQIIRNLVKAKKSL